MCVANGSRMFQFECEGKPYTMWDFITVSIKITIYKKARAFPNKFKCIYVTHSVTFTYSYKSCEMVAFLSCYRDDFIRSTHICFLATNTRVNTTIGLPPKI